MWNGFVSFSTLLIKICETITTNSHTIIEQFRKEYTSSLEPELDNIKIELTSKTNNEFIRENDMKVAK